MFECRFEPGEDLGGGFEERLAFGVIDLGNILTQMLNQLGKLSADIGGVGSRIFGRDRFHKQSSFRGRFSDSSIFPRAEGSKSEE
jgi:hypothetical protein